MGRWVGGSVGQWVCLSLSQLVGRSGQGHFAATSADFCQNVASSFPDYDFRSNKFNFLKHTCRVIVGRVLPRIKYVLSFILEEFLVAKKRLCKRLCPSVRPLVRGSKGPLVRRSVGQSLLYIRFLMNRKEKRILFLIQN